MSQPKTIWYVSKYVAPPQGTSVGSRGYELMRELAARGHTTVIVTSDANHLTQVPSVDGRVLHQVRDGLDMYWLRTFKAATAKSWQRIVSWLDFERQLFSFNDRRLPRPDVIIVSSLSLLTVFNGLLLKRRYRAPLVFEVRDIWPLTLVEEGGFAPTNAFVKALGMVERLGYRRADVVVGTMPALGKHVRAVSGSDRPVHCVPMGFSTRVENVEEEVPAPPSPPGELIVGYAGTVGVTNALEVFFDAARQLRDRPEIRFRVIGDGPLLPGFREEYADLDNVEFVGRVAKEDVRRELQKCDLLYLGTYRSEVWEYGQSLNKVIDYMLSGRPILASYSGFPSMIDEADCGVFVEAGNSALVAAEILRFVAVPPADRDVMGRRGRTWLLEHRSFAQLARDYEAVLFGADLAPTPRSDLP